jgi:hypothetical protein
MGIGSFRAMAKSPLRIDALDQRAFPSSLPALAALLLGIVASGDVHAAKPCPAGLFGVAAQIVRVEPAGALASKRLASGQEELVGVDGLVCKGDILELKPGGPVSRVELYAQGQKKVLVSPDRFESKQGAISSVTQALTFVTGILQGAESIIKPPPDIPGPTAARGGNANTPTLVLQIRAMRLLRDLPRQSLTVDVRPVLSWRDGVEPYVCQAMSDLGDVVWQEPAPQLTSWCEMAPELHQAAQLVVRDARGRTESWNIRRVAWAEVPRPEWIGLGTNDLSSADRTAWAWWLWKVAGPTWRLQALAMLHEMAPEVFIAGYLRNQLLAESAQYAP